MAMLELVHRLLVVIYVVLPPAAVVASVIRARRERQSIHVYRTVLIIVAGFALGAALAIVYSRAVLGTLGFGQALVAGYFTASVFLFIRGADFVLRRGIAWALRLPAPEARGRWRVYAVTRALLFVGLGWPYVIAVGATYRPRLAMRETPMEQFGFAFERVDFEAIDGVTLSGWWIPSKRESERTVIVCHGMEGNKSTQLLLARELVPGGFNVLIFDFRAHGESSGQIATFGDLERRDVLGAVRWVRANRAEASEKICGVGVGTGAAALIAAAAEQSSEGQAIEAIALYAPFARFENVARSVTDQFFLPPLNWLSMNVAMPMASMHAGAGLADFAPIELIDRVWPRPILIIHGVNDGAIPFNESLVMYNHAPEPKDCFWLYGAGHEDVMRSATIARRVREFFDSARSVPVI